jgi:hypothetical protein
MFLINNVSDTYSKQNNSETLKNLKDSIDKYYHSFNINKLKQTLVDCDNYLKQNTDSYYGYYYFGMLNYNLGKIYYNINSDSALEYFSQSIDLFHKAEKMNRNAEIAALLSAAYGKKSSLAGIQSIFFGLKAKSWIYDANDLDSSNPKVYLTAATHLMHTPKFYGGDKTKARNLLLKILELNKTYKYKDPFELNWSDNAETYAYLAQLEILEENIPKARQYMKKALESVPDYGFVTIDLESQIKKYERGN